MRKYIFNMAKKIETSLPDHVIVEVVMRKEMTMASYMKLLSNDKRKGWKIQAYQQEVFSPGLNKEID